MLGVIQDGIRPQVKQAQPRFGAKAPTDDSGTDAQRKAAAHRTDFIAFAHPAGMFRTHEIRNQVPFLENYNLYDNDPVLQEVVGRENAQWAKDRIRKFGETLGKAETIQLGFDANEHLPRLKTHDRHGRRIDQVEFHPSYHALMKLAKENEVHSLSWTDNRQGAHVARAALFYMLAQAEGGVCCPISMTHAGAAVLRRQAGQSEMAAKWLKALSKPSYDSRVLPFDKKTGATMGMGMTEKQGGSDVQANTAVALPVGKAGPGEEFRLIGHKWFCSAPMSDAFLTLAQTENGLTCFIVPRWLPDGSTNRFFIQRLKDKHGNRSNASSEIEYADTRAWQIGETGKGVQTIIEMVNHTRLDCVISSAAIIRQATVQAINHAMHREAFGKRLIDQPAMRNVLADLSVESEAATLLAMRLARAFDDGDRDPKARKLARIMTPVSKYWICKRAESAASEAMECLGGNGYVMESIMPRLLREAKVNSMWEGPGNIMVLDVLRAIQKDPETVPAFFEEMEKAKGKNDRFDQFVDALKKEFTNPNDLELRGRYVVGQMARALQASLLLRQSPKSLSDAFIASRLTAGDGNFGTLPANADLKAILERTWPPVKSLKPAQAPKPMDFKSILTYIFSALQAFLQRFLPAAATGNP